MPETPPFTDDPRPGPGREAWRSGLSSASPHVRAAVVEWLAEHAPDALAAVADGVLRDPHPRVRAVAAVACRASAEPAVVDLARRTLRELLLGNDAERRAGLRAAIRLANPFSIPRLVGFLDHPDPVTRRLALRAVTVPDPGLLAPGHIRRCIEPLLADPVPAVRAAACRALAARGGRPAGRAVEGHAPTSGGAIY